jgi:hypothetical protein
VTSRSERHNTFAPQQFINAAWADLIHPTEQLLERADTGGARKKAARRLVYAGNSYFGTGASLNHRIVP